MMLTHDLADALATCRIDVAGNVLAKQNVSSVNQVRERNGGMGTHRARYAGHWGVAQGETDAGVALVDAVDPQFLEGRVGGDGRDESHNDSELLEHLQNWRCLRFSRVLRRRKASRGVAVDLTRCLYRFATLTYDTADILRTVRPKLRL